jgi:tRNA pseudouridine32 synthase/23S rRNA pseudouridine746 synthase
MFKTQNTCFHPIEVEDSLDLPEQFTYPFYYQPHPLCVKAADEIKSYLQTQTDFDHNFGLDATRTDLKIGKMFGVMIIESENKTLGYIAAFSGKLAESNYIKGFVPPIFDTLNAEGFYKKGEAYTNVLSDKIEAIETSDKLKKAKLNLERTKLECAKTLERFKNQSKSAKEQRRQQRLEAEATLSTLEREVFFENLKQQSIETNLKLKYLKLDCEKRIGLAEKQLAKLKEPLSALKQERKVFSASLQKQIHEQYHFLNSQGETKNLLDIFEATDLGQPPAAAGECAAPKLFQFAFKNKLKPIAMAEFWWGSSPKSEVRRHGQFYPSCRGKCEPILGHMMRGLNVEPNPMDQVSILKQELEIVYEDDDLLLVNKPHEFLSVPGKTITDSVLTRMQAYLTNATGPLLLHRLDMSTSGLLLVAKNEWTHKNLQRQFIKRTVKKRYVAVLDGELEIKEGLIDLPLRVDLNNRPRQLVCYDHGKPAKTKFEVIEIINNKTRIHFYPISGRTHQLRVHAAHHLGLNMPIVGDDLYGNPSNRLHLHAETLSFKHPVKRECMTFTCEAPF